MLPRTLAAIPLIALTALAASLPACTAQDGEGESSEDAISFKLGVDLPWEVSTPQGEKVLPNLFYAEASENEQVMPTTIGGRNQIDRLVYPTIGNPNLFVKSGTDDAFMTVLRVERSILEKISGKVGGAVSGSKFYPKAPSFLREYTAASDDKNGIKFYLVAVPKTSAQKKSVRAEATESNAPLSAREGVIEIKPTAIYAHAITDDMPAAFKARQTLRVMFDAAAMSKVPAGMYDVRMEIVKDGKILGGDNGGAYEYQYNALRVFDKAATSYHVLNVTDTQASVGTQFQKNTYDKLVEFVSRMNNVTDESIQDAAFITFNGDLHNSGSPEVIAPKGVAWTYNKEANAILEALKELNYPIFLTIGNHDGYVATGNHPAAFDALPGGSLESVVKEARPDFDWASYQKYLEHMKNEGTMGGRHVDVFAGAHIRHRSAKGALVSTTFAQGWEEVPREQRNVVLYDGNYQWQRTYGPTYMSWKFGKNRYVNLNSYELRQHRRSGWGMYTVNYGGGLSPHQMFWAEMEFEQAEKAGEDVVLIAHHDPRGGHNGKDYPYYFKQIEFRGMDESAKNYVQGEVLNPKICELAPEWVKTDAMKLSCLHDGLQEWMRPDAEFDCEEKDRKADGKCDIEIFNTKVNKHPWYSGYTLIDSIQWHTRIRTMLLGHTHYNSIEMLQAGQRMIPNEVTLDADSVKERNENEVANPLRALAFFHEKDDSGKDPNAEKSYDPKSIANQGITKDAEGRLTVDLAKAGHAFSNCELKKVCNLQAPQGKQRELAVVRLTSAALLTSQVDNKSRESMYGFATFAVTPRQGYDAPQINAIKFFRNDGRGFEEVLEHPLDRTATFGNYLYDARGRVTSQPDPKNPLKSVFSMKK